MCKLFLYIKNALKSLFKSKPVVNIILPNKEYYYEKYGNPDKVSNKYIFCTGSYFEDCFIMDNKQLEFTERCEWKSGEKSIIIYFDGDKTIKIF
jgi:hypothetical protein